MSLIRRIADYFAPTQAPALEERAREVSWDALRGGVDLGTTGIVNPRMAENLSTVLACVGAISSGMASLPAYVYRQLERGREIDAAHPITRLIAIGPNQHQTWADFVEWVMASVLLRGNALAEIVTDARGAVTELRPIPWEHVSVQLLQSGRLVYDVTEIVSLYGGTGRPRRLLQDEVFHLRDRSDDGLVGRSRLQRAAAVVQAGLGMQDFAVALYRNGVNPSGALEMEAKLSPEQRALLTENFRKAFAGGANAARALVLDQGMTWKQISISPEDAEFLASRRFTVEELARLFGCPPPIVGDLSHGTFSNTETVGRWFATHTLAPWIRKVEAEFSRSVFSAASRSTHRLEIDMSGFLRGDPAQRWQAWKIAVEANILDVDEVREEEGWNPRGAPAVS
ncbi:MAG: phage portal protein [Burkholderiales bacterium]|nr:phage portal protein [Burkholderiales bacterium]